MTNDNYLLNTSHFAEHMSNIINVKYRQKKDSLSSCTAKQISKFRFCRTPLMLREDASNSKCSNPAYTIKAS